ncbi:MAG: DUF4252 domain-containing protein [Paludibacter sp.]|nr:DUF4252 domain-containing protein [Paludibacter sp.]
MRRIIIIVVTFIVMLFSGLKSQTLNSFFKKYNGNESFESVTVNKMAFGLAMLAGDLEKDERDVLSAMHKIKILTSKDSTLALDYGKLMDEFEEVVKHEALESALSVREKGEKVDIYTKTNGTKFTDMVIAVREKDEFSLIWLNGNFDQDMVHKIQNGKMLND